MSELSKGLAGIVAGQTAVAIIDESETGGGGCSTAVIVWGSWPRSRPLKRWPIC